MKAPPPRSLKLAIGSHAPSPQVLVMAMLGGAGLTAGGMASSSSGRDARNNSDGQWKGADEEGTSRSSTTRLSTPRILTAGTTPAYRSMSPRSAPPAASRILSTSSNILGAGDASAERSASSLASAARLSGTSSAISLDAHGAAKAATETKRNATENHGDNNNKEKSESIDEGAEEESNGTSDSADGNNDERARSSGREDSYPAFTPYHRSLLKKYLTPEVWDKLSGLRTSHGTTIEDIIRAGLALPIGANPPRRVGVLVGDAECYATFRELLDPIISEYHGIDCFEEWNDPELPMERYFATGKGAKSAVAGDAASPGDDYGVIKSSGADEDSDENDDSSFLLNEEDDMFVEYVALPSSAPTTTTTTTNSNNDDSQSTQSAPSSPPAARHVEAIASKRKAQLRRHPTIINNPRLVTNREADPEGRYILSTRVRVARSLDGVKFPATMSRGDRRRVQRLVDECARHFREPNLSGGVYLPVLGMTNDENLDLIERHVLFDNPNEWTIASGLGRDWPDGRALYANVDDLRRRTPDFMIWVNEEDHLRVMCLREGGDIQGVFTTVMTGVRELERELTERGWRFAYDSRLGYLTSCPTNVGTTMRASVHVRLTNLGRLPGFFELVQRLKLEARGKYGETDRRSTGVFDISNAERLGKSEVHLINLMVEGVAKLIELERRLEAGEEVNIDEIA